MTPVEFLFLTPDGIPIPNALVEIQLSRSSFDDEDSGVLMPRPVEVYTDLAGKVTVSLMPSKVTYFVTVQDTISDMALSYEFFVPKITSPVTSVRLQDLVIDGPISSKPYDEVALGLIQDAKVHTLAALVEAREAAQLARESISTVTEARTAAELSAVNAKASEAIVNSDTASAHISSIQASNAQKLAENAAVAATTKVNETVTLVNVATQKAAEAATSSTTALASSKSASLAEVNAKAARDMALRAMPITSALPPTNPLPNQEWINSTTLRKYTWLVEDATWAEVGAIIVIADIDSNSGSGNGVPFNPGSLPTSLTITNSTSLLVEEGGVGYRIPFANAGMTIHELDQTNTLKPTDFIIITQDGIDKRVSLASLASALNQFNVL